MAFEPGHEKLGGKVKGTLNKKNQEIQDLAKELGCNPAKILMLILLGDNEALGTEEPINLDRKTKAAESLMPYLYGKRKPIDSNGDDSDNILAAILSGLDGTK